MNMMWHYKCHVRDVKCCLITQCWIYVYKMSRKIIHYIIYIYIYKYRNGLLSMQYVFLIRSSAGCKKYVTRRSRVTYFLQPARETVSIFIHIRKISISPAICCYTLLVKVKNVKKMLLTLKHLNRVLTYSCEHFEDLI